MAYHESKICMIKAQWGRESFDACETGDFSLVAKNCEAKGRIVASHREKIAELAARVRKIRADRKASPTATASASTDPFPSSTTPTSTQPDIVLVDLEESKAPMMI